MHAEEDKNEMIIQENIPVVSAEEDKIKSPRGLKVAEWTGPEWPWNNV